MMGYKLERLTVLVVDDNKNMRSLVRAILEALGVNHIVDAIDGEAAFKKLEEQQIDLIIADWNMEPMDGLAFTRKVRTDPGSPDQFVPIIMLSGHTEKARVMQARDAGINEFMAKPIAARALYARMVAIIEHPRPFVKTESYFGPDRRRQDMPFPGPDRRTNQPAGAKDGKAAPGKPGLSEDQQRALSQAKDAIRTLNKP
jgi:CheY-like chemotaxis protein